LEDDDEVDDLDYEDADGLHEARGPGDEHAVEAVVVVERELHVAHAGDELALELHVEDDPAAEAGEHDCRGAGVVREDVVAMGVCADHLVHKQAAERHLDQPAEQGLAQEVSVCLDVLHAFRHLEQLFELVHLVLPLFVLQLLISFV